MRWYMYIYKEECVKVCVKVSVIIKLSMKKFSHKMMQHAARWCKLVPVGASWCWGNGRRRRRYEYL